ncbi:MAG TPA: HAD-IA family hydrolase, partial [Nitrospiria bacterium]
MTRVPFKAELLIFDLDGTLADTKEDLADCVNRALREVGLREKSREVIYSYVGSGVRSLIRQALDEEPGPKFEDAIGVFRKYYLKHLLDKTRLYPGMAGVLDHFDHKRKAVVTNKPQVFTDKILSGLKVTERFEIIVGGENGHPLKPDPKMILEVLNHTGVEAGRAVMIGDGLNDILAARAAGVPCCAVGYGIG